MRTINKINVMWIICATLVILFAFVQFVLANPSYFANPVSTAAATTTTAYMSPGVGTTTLALDTYQAGNTAKIDSALLAFQWTSTSTISVPKMNVRVEYAIGREGVDCSVTQSACDWYPQSSAVVTLATSTVMNSYADYQFAFATSSIADFGGSSFYSSPTSTITNSLPITAPARFIRVKFYVPIGSGRGGLWATLVPVREIR